MSEHRVVIVGAGFGGLSCARKLTKVSGVHVTLVDRNPYHLFAPLLYQVATGGLPDEDIAYSIRGAIPGVDFRRGEVVRMDLAAKTLRLDDGTVMPWDDLVIATGSVGTTFGVPGVAEHALQMKSIRQAREIRDRLLATYEEVDNGHKPKEHLRVIVVGGGPTGVEVAGAVAELQRTMRREFPRIADAAHVTLVEAGPRILPMFTEKSSAHAKEELEELGASVKVNAAVDRMYPTDVHLKSGEVLVAGTIVWAAGVAAPPEWTGLGLADRSNRLRVNEMLQLDDHAWVIGDTANFEGPDGRPLPMVAPVAACRRPDQGPGRGWLAHSLRVQGQGPDGDDRTTAGGGRGPRRHSPARHARVAGVARAARVLPRGRPQPGERRGELDVELHRLGGRPAPNRH